jgi:hypothetical protein
MTNDNELAQWPFAECFLTRGHLENRTGRKRAFQAPFRFDGNDGTKFPKNCATVWFDFNYIGTKNQCAAVASLSKNYEARRTIGQPASPAPRSEWDSKSIARLRPRLKTNGIAIDTRVNE